MIQFFGLVGVLISLSSFAGEKDHSRPPYHGEQRYFNSPTAAGPRGLYRYEDRLQSQMGRSGWIPTASPDEVEEERRKRQREMYPVRRGAARTVVFYVTVYNGDVLKVAKTIPAGSNWTRLEVEGRSVVVRLQNETPREAWVNLRYGKSGHFEVKALTER